MLLLVLRSEPDQRETMTADGREARFRSIAGIYIQISRYIFHDGVRIAAEAESGIVSYLDSGRIDNKIFLKPVCVNIDKTKRWRREQQVENARKPSDRQDKGNEV